MSKLYHREVYWLSYFDTQSQLLIKSANRLSYHLWQHIEEDNQPKYDIDVTKLFLIVKSLDNVEPFEVEVDSGLVTKCVVRVEYNDKKDISIVFRDGVIVTAWLNFKTDLHGTLDRSKYEGGDK